MSLFRWSDKQKPDGQDVKIRLQLSESYANMVNTVAWKDMEVFLNEMVKQSVKDMDLVPIGNLGLAESAEGRGIRKAVENVKKHISFYVREEGE